MHISALYVYPIKSCGGVRLEAAKLDARGLAHDRCFMVVDEHGVFVTQREEPKLALFRCVLDAEALIVTHADAGSLRIHYACAGEKTRTRLWEDEVSAFVCAEASTYFSDALKRRVRLVRQPEDAARVANVARAGDGHLVSFADGYPLLLANESSRLDVAARAGCDLPMTRFRPNIVVSGMEAWAEDDLSAFTLGGVRMRAVKPCERCSITTVDPNTGVRGVEPLRALAGYRQHAGKVHFGVNVVHDALGALSLGQALDRSES